MKNVYKQAGERISYVRKARGYSRTELAQRAEITSRFLCEIEAGRTGFSVEVLYNICKVLNVDCDYILIGNEKEVIDKRLIDILLLFDINQTERLVSILKDIHKLTLVVEEADHSELD